MIIQEVCMSIWGEVVFEKLGEVGTYTCNNSIRGYKQRYVNKIGQVRVFFFLSVKIRNVIR